MDVQSLPPILGVGVEKRRRAQWIPSLTQGCGIEYGLDDNGRTVSLGREDRNGGRRERHGDAMGQYKSLTVTPGGGGAGGREHRRKIADAEWHFTGGPVDGLKLIGFGMGSAGALPARTMTFPVINGERRTFTRGKRCGAAAGAPCRSSVCSLILAIDSLLFV